MERIRFVLKIDWDTSVVVSVFWVFFAINYRDFCKLNVSLKLTAPLERAGNLSIGTYAKVYRNSKYYTSDIDL